MKTFTSAAIGAAMLATTLGFAQPSEARSNVGVYVGPGGVGISVDRARGYCRDEYYRRNHWSYCSRFYGGGYHYSNYRYNHRHRHWNRRYNRWDWD